MNFYLAHDVSCGLEAALTSKTQKVIELNLNGYPTRSEGDEKLFNKFKTALDHELGLRSLQRSMSMEFSPLETPKKESKSALNLWNVTLKSDIFGIVHDVLYYGNPDIPLQVALELFYSINVDDSDYGYHTVTVEVPMNGFLHEKQEDFPKLHKSYVISSVGIDATKTSSDRRTWKVTIEVKGCDFVSLADIPLPNCSDLNRQIFQKKEFCDFEIISEDGTAIPCHKMFLSAKSPVFGKMLHENKFIEAREHKMTIADMSTRGISALLEFLYCYDIRLALAYCDVSLELLKAADKYDIDDLWKAVVPVLMKQSVAWYNVDGALKLSYFVVNCEREECAGLRNKMVEILAAKSEELPNSAVYSELFPTPVSRQMFKLALEKAKV